MKKVFVAVVLILGIAFISQGAYVAVEDPTGPMVSHPVVAVDDPAEPMVNHPVVAVDDPAEPMVIAYRG